MTSKRVFFIMSGVVGLFALANVGAVVGGNLMLQKKSQDLTSLKLDSRVLDEQQNSLKQAKKDIQKYSDLESIAKSVVPQDKDQAEAVREIVKIANDNGIVLSTISFPASTLGQIVPKATSGTGNTTPSVSATPGITQVQPVQGITGVFSLQINIQQEPTRPVSYTKLISFLTALEQNRRTAQVTNVVVTPSGQDRSLLTFSLTLITYIKP